MRLLHVGKETIYDNITGVGLFSFPPGKAIEIQDEFLAKAILNHRKLDGLVAVPEIETDTGIKFDLETAKKKAAEALRAGRRELFDSYVKDQQEYRIAAGKPPLPPSPIVQRIIEEDGYRLSDYGIYPKGFKVDDAAVKQDAEMDSLRQQNKLLMGQVQALMEKVEELASAGKNAKSK